MPKLRDPESAEEWQQVADLAEYYTHLHAAVDYGLVNYAPTINLRRCEELLWRAAKRGIQPTPGCIERMARLHAAESVRWPAAGRKQ